MLYTISSSPFSNGSWQSLLLSVSCCDVVVLIQNGVLAGLRGTQPAEKLLSTEASIYALKVDILARAVDQHMDDRIQCIDYLEFVALTVHYTPQLAW